MTYVPAVPMGGLAGWRFLERTRETQQAAHNADAAIQRDLQHFRNVIGSMDSAEKLVADRRVLGVALGAFGLSDDLDNRFFIRKVLESPRGDTKALAGRLSDPRYTALAEAFGYGDIPGGWTATPGFADRIASGYLDRSFESAVGDVSPDMRLALGLERELRNLTGRSQSADAQWFSVMSSQPLRAVFEGALGLPASFASLDLDQQLSVFRERADSVFGVREVADFASPEKLSALRERFLALASIRPTGGGAQSGAMSLLSGAGSAAGILSALYG